MKKMRETLMNGKRVRDERTVRISTRSFDTMTGTKGKGVIVR